MSSVARLTLRPPPHRDYLHGYPGIPASDESQNHQVSPQTRSDPILTSLVVHPSRPQAHLSGTVEVRAPANSAGSKDKDKRDNKDLSKEGPGRTISARWLRIELEKIETLPAPPAGVNDITGAAPPDARAKGGSKAVQSREVRFVELIGVGPGTLWSSKDDKQETDGHGDNLTKVKTRKYEEDEEDDDEHQNDEWGLIEEGNYAFKIPIPEGLPPSCELDLHGSTGVSYRLVASLYAQEVKHGGGMSLFGSKKSKKKIKRGKPVLVNASAQVLILKADILPAWPAYAPLLPQPVPKNLPWNASNGLTPGQTKEARARLQTVEDDDATAGELVVKCVRPGAAIGPGDIVPVHVELNWTGALPIKVTRIDFTLKETISFKYPQGSNVVKATPRVNVIASTTLDNQPSATSRLVILYPNEPRALDMESQIPGSHSRVTIRTAKYVDVTYHIKVRVIVEGGHEVTVDNWPVVMGAVSMREAKGIVQQIGWVDGLCNRPGVPGPTVEPIQQAQNGRMSSALSFASDECGTVLVTAQTRTIVSTPVRRISIANLVEQFEEPQASTSGHNLAEGSSSQIRRPSIIDANETPPPPAVSDHHQHLSAEEEKRRLYEHAKHTAEVQQQSLEPDRSGHILATATEQATNILNRSLTTAEQEKVRLHQRAADKRDELQRLARKARESIASSSNQSGDAVPSDKEKRLYHEAARRRNELQSSIDGSTANVPAASNGHVNSDRLKMIEQAKADARLRQEQARLELERQAAVLAQIEAEEQQARKEEEERVRLAEQERLRLEEYKRLEREALEERRQVEEEQRREREHRQAEEQRYQAALAQHHEQQMRARQEQWDADAIRQQAMQAAREEQARIFAAQQEELRREREQLERERAELQRAREQSAAHGPGSSPHSPANELGQVSVPAVYGTRSSSYSYTPRSEAASPSTFAPVANLDQATTAFYAQAIAQSSVLARNTSLAHQHSMSRPLPRLANGPRSHLPQQFSSNNSVVSMATAPAPSAEEHGRYVSTVDDEDYSFSPVSPLRVNGVSLASNQNGHHHDSKQMNSSTSMSNSNAMMAASAPDASSASGEFDEQHREEVRYGKRAVVDAEADDSLPIYATNDDNEAAKRTLSAQEEKARIDQFYQRAKAAVAAQQQNHDDARPIPPRRMTGRQPSHEQHP